MRHLNLRNKIALFAVASCAVALIGGALGTWMFLRYEEIRALDQRLVTDSEELFRDMENFAGGPGEPRGQVSERIVPLALRGRWIELLGPRGETLYRSANLGGASLADAPPGFSTRTFAGRAVRVGRFEHGELRLFVGVDLEDVWRVERNLGYAFLAALPVVAAIIAIAGRWLGRRALEPVVEITRAAGQITAERLDRRLPEPAARDEIHGLVAVLNVTFERLQRSFEQAVRFSADASHQLKTPLTLLRIGLDELLHSPKCDGREKAAVNELLDQVRRLTSLTEDLLLLARADAGRLQVRREPCDLRPVFDDCLDDTRALAEGRGLELEVELPARIDARADAASVAIILQNLFENAVKYNCDGGRIRVRASTPPPWLEVRVGNTSKPIPPDRQAHLFERFFRAESDERIAGTGLGLSLARELARAHGGELELVGSDAGWTEFALRLPSARK